MPYFGVPIRNGLPIGLGTLTALAQAVAVVVPPVSSDPYFEYVSLLANTTSTNGAQNNTFLDGSTNAFSITRNGNTTQGNFSPFSQTGWSNYFDGTGDELSLANNAAFELGSGDFCYEAFVYALRSANTFGQGIISYGVAGSTGSSTCDLEINASGYLQLAYATGASSTLTDTTTLPINQWVHVVACRTSSTLSIYVNGTRVATASTSATVGTGGTMTIGGQWYASASTRQLNGYISNARVVKGSSPYNAANSTLTVPTAPLTAITNTSLLTCQSNRFIDNSSNAFAITRNGDVSVQAFSPFNPTAAWSASTNGGSGYFDGAGDFLSVPSATALNLSTGAFTIEAFVNLSATTYVVSRRSSATARGLILYYDTANSKFNFLAGDTNTTAWEVNIASTNTYPLSQWIHVAVTRDSSDNFTLWVNGTSQGTANSNVIIADDASNLLICGIDGAAVGSGYISNLRIVKGTAVYTANFTPPTAPLTAITNTSLLLNFTNAGIYDSASGNDLETVGNAQVSTVQAKWGTTSMAFDGTGDSLTAVDRPALRFGTAPFTIEGWVYLNVINATQGIASKRNATPTGWFLQVTPSNKLQLTFDASTIASTASLAASTWYHFAIVREGTGTNQTKLYINGVNDGTGTVANNFNQTDALAVGSDRGLGSYLNGYIDDLRITNGYARYTANFTPPTAAFPLN